LAVAPRVIRTVGRRLFWPVLGSRDAINDDGRSTATGMSSQTRPVPWSITYVSSGT